MAAYIFSGLLINTKMSDKNFFPLLMLVVLFSACMSTTYVQVLEPAQLDMEERIKTLVLVNRTQPQSKVGNILEGIVTGEGIGQDRSGTQQALAGLNRLLIESPRFEAKLTNIVLQGSGSGFNFPVPLIWQEVENICRSYNAEALIALETYDTDSKITGGTKEVTRKDKNGKIFKEIVHTANQRVRIKMGFRIYDPVRKSIIDEFHITEEMEWDADGPSEADARSNLISKRAAIDRVSSSAGANYGHRIAPMWINVQRHFYKKSKGDERMEEANRKASVGDWNGAAAIWKEVTQNADEKTAGRAAYNMALANEVMGKLELAKDWAIQSYTKYGNKKAKQYANILESRILDQERVNQQMQGAQ